ncbi:MAG: nucleotidyltransferase [Candidatus Cloacimonadota bacterium]|nr:MAG: nucleotidyltransferase [Candidatus Cloacimonadota bacterium]
MLFKKLQTAVVQAKCPLLFATLSGSHLYGFPSKDSDFDLRGAHILKRNEIIGLYDLNDTIDFMSLDLGIELDLVTHDVTKFFKLLLKRNGYVLEQLYSPLIVHTTPEHKELKHIVKNCITKHHFNHYLGFFRSQWKLLIKEKKPKIKPLLYCFRVLFTGIHLMKTGLVEANLINLNKELNLSYINDLIEQKLNGDEKGYLDTNDFSFFEKEAKKYENILILEGELSKLPDKPNCKAQLNDLLLRIRDKYGV